MYVQLYQVYQGLPGGLGGNDFLEAVDVNVNDVNEMMMRRPRVRVHPAGEIDHSPYLVNRDLSACKVCIFCIKYIIQET